MNKSDWKTYPTLPDGVPCDHPGCLSHISHPCEGCGRINGRNAPSPSSAVADDEFEFSEMESGKHDLQFHCEWAVFPKANPGSSLCYVTSEERAKWISARLNELLHLRSARKAAVVDDDVSSPVGGVLSPEKDWHEVSESIDAAAGVPTLPLSLSHVQQMERDRKAREFLIEIVNHATCISWNFDEQQRDPIHAAWKEFACEALKALSVGRVQRGPQTLPLSQKSPPFYE